MAEPAAPSILRRLWALSGRDRRLLVEAWFALAVAATRLRLAPRRTVARALAGPQPPGNDARPSAGTSQELFLSTRCEAAGTSPQAVALAVSRAAAHHLAAMTCLPRAIAVQKMLARRGIASALRIGVRKDSGGTRTIGTNGTIGTIAAHAWVEVGGVALGEPEAIAERFRPLLPALTPPRE